MLEAAHHNVAPPREIVDLDTEVGKAREQAGNCHACLRPREPGTDAEVDAAAKGQMRVRSAIEPQLAGLRKDCRIAIGCADYQDQLLAGPDLPTGQFEVFRAHASRQLHRAFKTQEFFDGPADEPGVLAQARHRAGIPLKAEHAVADQVDGRLLTRRKQHRTDRRQVALLEVVMTLRPR